VYSDLILRGRGSQVAQAAGARPTVVTLWIGNNDVLGAATSGIVVDGVTITPVAQFEADYRLAANAIAASGAKMAIANIPDVTSIPFVTTVSRFIPNPQTGQPVIVNGQPLPLLGPNGPLPPGTLVTLAAGSLIAQGHGIPAEVGGRSVRQLVEQAFTFKLEKGAGEPLFIDVAKQNGRVVVVGLH